MKKAIFFDLDGTLWDALDSLTKSWNETCKNNNLPYFFSYKLMKSFMGLTPKETIELVFNDVDYKKGEEYFKLCLNDEIVYLEKNPGKLYLNEEEILKKLAKKYPLFIVSNSDQGYIEDFLKAYDFNKYFVDHLCYGDLKLEKYQNILYLKNKYQIDEVIYVGDTLKDYKESSKAGVKFIHAAYGFGKIDDKVHAINSLNELEKEITKVFNE